MFWVFKVCSGLLSFFFLWTLRVYIDFGMVLLRLNAFSSGRLHYFPEVFCFPVFLKKPLDHT